MPKPASEFNSRKYQGQVEREVIVGGLLIGIVVGGGLIAIIWGSTVFFTALSFFALFLGLIVLVWLFLKLLEIFSRD